MPNPTNPNQPPRDLRVIAQQVAEHPTLAKKVLRSKALGSHRRAVQSKGAAASYAVKALQKVVSFGFGQIPVPAVGSVLDKAWGFAGDKARDYHLDRHTGMAVSPADKVKFELKAIGGRMANLDRSRWKIAHAIEQCNKAEADQKHAPCDRVVRLWAKRKYLDLRIEKLKVDLATMQGVITATEDWLKTVEAGGSIKTEQELTQAAGSHVASLKNADHSECRNVYCMYGTKDWTSQKSVPTSGLAKHFMQISGEVTALAAGDPVSDALGEI
jgi:hypothetical protein